MDGTRSKRWDALLERMDKLRQRNWQVEGDLIACRGALQDSREQVRRLEEQLAEARGEIATLKKQLAELTAAVHGLKASAVGSALPAAVVSPPAFVKANVVKEESAGRP